jgi:hypothetical protein
MGIPEGRGKMGGSHMGRENTVPKKNSGPDRNKIFSYFGLTKTNLVSNF